MRLPLEPVGSDAILSNVRFKMLLACAAAALAAVIPVSHSVAASPAVSFSSLMGGADRDGAFDIGVDASGNIYVVGVVESGRFLGRRTGANGPDVFVAKLSPGRELRYLKFFGGSEDDEPSALDVMPDGRVFVTGTTNSTDFPVRAALQRHRHGFHPDAFVLSLSPAGQLRYSTYLGGSDYDEGLSIAVDRRGSAYVFGTASMEFPLVDPLEDDIRDLFISKIGYDGERSRLVYSTYFGSSAPIYAEDAGDIEVDTAGNAYVTGQASSSTFPLINAYDATLDGPTDAFVSKLARSGRSLRWSTFLGGSSSEWGYGIAIDQDNNVFVTGTTESPTDFPVVDAMQPMMRGTYADAFVSNFVADGSGLDYSTYLGGGGPETYSSGEDIAVNSRGAAYVAGLTSSTEYPTKNAVQTAFAGPLEDAVVTKLSATGSLAMSTYWGGNDADFAEGIDLYRRRIYIAGFTASSDFPTRRALDRSCTVPDSGPCSHYDGFVGVFSE